MKKFGTAALSLALAGALTLPALAAQDTPLLISSGPYTTAITLNGETLDTAHIPAASQPDLLPMRLVAESDHGSALWDQETDQGQFYLGEDTIVVRFSDRTIWVNDELVKTQVEVHHGVTYIPAGILSLLDGYTVTDHTEAGGGVEITTPNNAPLVKLAYAIQENSDSFGMRTYEEQISHAYGIPADQFEEIVAFFPMITSPDTVIVGKLAEGADQKAVTDALETYRQQQEDTFSWYLSQHLPKVQDARTVVENGYVLFLIGENADEGEAIFRSFAEAQG